MGVALNQTLRARGIKSLVYKGMWDRIVDRRCNGSDIFIGAGVTEKEESTHADIDLCAEDETLFGFVVGICPQLETIPALGMWYNDYDVPFSDNVWVRVGIPTQGMVILVLSATNVNINKGEKIHCVDGVFQRATTDGNYQMFAKEAVTGAASTRKYFYARFVRN